MGGNEGLASDFRADCERVYREWDERAKALDTEGLLALYTQDAVLESPLVRAILDDNRTACCAAMTSCAVFR